MKRSLLALAASVAVVAFAVQGSLPSLFLNHAAKLKGAQGLKARVLVDEVGGARTVYDVTYAKPGMFRIETDARLVVSDGTTVTSLEKAKNTYSQAPADAVALTKHTTETGVWGWAPFFEPDSAKLVKSGRAGAKAKRRGVDVTEVEANLLDGTTTVTLYIETKSGIVRGYLMKKEGKEYIVWAESVAATPEAPAAPAFSFTAPEGSKKVEEGAVGDATWATVGAIFARRCMPCHSPGISSGSLELSTYDGASKNRFVVSGSSKTSALALALRASGPKRMPQGRPPLPEAEIKTIEAWIDGGLKQ